jgi:hypothetical protein
MNLFRLSLNLLRRDWRAGEWRVLCIFPLTFTGAPKVGNPLSGKPDAELAHGQGITSDLAALPPSRMASSFIRE